MTDKPDGWNPYPVVNLNGTSLRTLLVQQRDLIDACDRVITALSCSMPHPRDYPGDNEAWEVARAHNRAEQLRMSQIRNAAHKRAEAILAQAGPESWRRAGE